ncbi:translation initiation factor IF-2 [Streptomyces tropicalis]|uniref:Translation initiation factor IF-2 n=1 Tax=Streptomyces tropicalis TaxID=3034234 RepID=A0ABT5ZZG2_9ACTN|nr:translation initiation factor IF-2 [Streptomyces tropicalis]MDF3297769.1 translation initiation factor IF-2 [Streptomyces tropicalis]
MRVKNDKNVNNSESAEGSREGTPAAWPAAAPATGEVPAAENDVRAVDGTAVTRALRVTDPWQEPVTARERLTEDTPDPNELTVRLDRAAEPGDPSAARDPGGRGGGGSDGPVFVDESGRRSRRFRRFGMGVGLTCAVYAVVIVVTLVSGNSNAPWLPVPGQADDAPAGKVDTSPVPSDPARPPGTGSGAVAPGTVVTAPGGTRATPDAAATRAAPGGSTAPHRPGASAAPRPSASASPKKPGSGATAPAVPPSTPSAAPSPDPSPSPGGGQPSPGPSPSPASGGTGSGGSGPGSPGTVADGPPTPTPVASEPGTPAPDPAGSPAPATSPPPAAGPSDTPAPAPTDTARPTEPAATSLTVTVQVA